MKFQCTREQLDRESEVSVSLNGLKNDALAAHAYKQAVQDAVEECLVWDYIEEWIESRADELMKEWTK